MKRLCALLLAILCLVPRLAFADVAFDGTCTRGTPAITSDHDVTHTVGASANFLIAFSGHDSSTNEGVSATWDFGGTAQAMTPIAEMDPGVGIVTGEAWVLVNPTPGTLTLRIVTEESSLNTEFVVCDFTGVDTGSPTGTLNEQEETAAGQTGSSLTFSINTGGLALSFLMGSAAWTNFAQGADQTQIFNSTAIAQMVLTWATVSPLNYTWNSSGIDFWHVVVPINAAQATAKRARLTIVE